MATTVYTYNDKVLKNVATDKWLKKPDAPAGFVMDASNATYTAYNGSIWVTWQSPSYPSGYNGNGKQYILVNNNSDTVTSNNSFMYCNNMTAGGPTAIFYENMNILGTSTGTLLNNMAGGDYGKYLSWPISDTNFTLEEAQAYIANVSITIVDP